MEDTWWGLEVYALAFGLMCCCCICCYLQKTKCCGILEDKYDNSYGGYQRQTYNGYSSVSQERHEKHHGHHQARYKKAAYGDHNDEQDLEMGVDEEDISDVAEMLHEE